MLDRIEDSYVGYLVNIDDLLCRDIIWLFWHYICFAHMYFCGSIDFLFSEAIFIVVL